MSALSLSGAWTGVFDYPISAMDPVPFNAELTDVAGVVWGETTEPNTFVKGGPAKYLTAQLSGFRSGQEVSFKKQYAPAIEGGEDPVSYVGTVAADGNRIEGKWTIQSVQGAFSGPFVMDRANGAASKQAVEATEKVEV